MHAGLVEAESALATGVRSEKIGLADFLHDKRVSMFDNLACSCGRGKQRTKNVIMYCLRHPGCREMSIENDTSNYRQLVERSKILRAIVR